jgi:hypothetical protein
MAHMALTHSHMLDCAAGLVLGCPSDALVTRNVNSFLPVGPKVTALFDDPVKPGKLQIRSEQAPTGTRFLCSQIRDLAKRKA